MPRKNYKWNISMDQGRKYLLDIIKGILQQQKNETMNVNELLLLIQNRSKHLIITNNQKKKSLLNFMNSNFGGIIHFADDYSCLAVFENSKETSRIKYIDSNFPMFDEWICVE